jgi:hypothetical protein
MDTSTNNILIFKAISGFIRDLSDLYGKEQHSLNLYRRLIEKTSIIHEQAISKNIEIFRKFCVANREAFQLADSDKVGETVIKYSDKVFIDMAAIFKLADSDSKQSIWKHLLTISAFVDPGSNAKKMLKEMSQDSKNKGGTGKEEDFLSSIIQKVEGSIDPEAATANPMAAISSIMTSGVFTDLIGSMQSGIESGELNIEKMLGTVQSMLGGLQTDAKSSGIDISSLMGSLPKF